MSANAPCPICGDQECCIWGDAQAHGINPKPRLTGGELLRRARANLSPEVLAAARRLAANGPKGAK